jgi:crossover junction endodeoxyribonuclease RuvC
MKDGVLGVDPGLSGGLAIVNDRGLIMDPMPTCGDGIDANALRRWLEVHKHEIEIAYVERAQAMPKQGVTSVFQYGRGFGILEATLAAVGIPVELVAPVVWAKAMHAGLSGETKAKSVVAAGKLFPAYDFRISVKAKKPHLGMVEAALLAEYGRRKLRGQA